MDSTPQFFKIWQWNCNSFNKKKANLTQLVRSCKEKPHVIILQECGAEKYIQNMSFSGYRVSRPTLDPDFKQARGIATLIRKDISFMERDTPTYKKGLESMITEIIPSRTLKAHLYILNVYSSPTDRLRNFTKLLSSAVSQAKDRPLIVAGDFNAHNNVWGYSTNDRKGLNLAECANNLNLKLITDSRFPTRRGNSVQRDTTPDLTFLGNAEGSWDNLQEDLGSDHFILEINVRITPAPPKTYRYVDWDLFRRIRGSEDSQGETFEELLENLKSTVAKATKEITLDLEVPVMDSRLAHLLEAKNALRRRWEKQKLNRRLRSKLREINKKIEEHSRELSAQQWDEVCNEADGKMRRGSKWSLLKNLFADSNKPTKSNARIMLDRLVHLHTIEGTSPQDFANTLADIYLPTESKSVPWDDPACEYKGTPQRSLDRPFEVSEIVHALHGLNGRSAPGPDGLTNKLLRNLDNQAIQIITKKINEVWTAGRVPDEWRTANIILIPKPGKPLHAENLRPISLTSCLGKVAEHVIHNRIAEHIEANSLFRHNLIGFRKSLSTQDAMLLIRSAVIDNKSRDVKGILALDITKAFDTVRHEHILNEISSLHLGEKFHNYVRSFLADRTATINIGQIRSRKHKLGNVGTPQGSVLSPLLFNIAMHDLANRLSKVHGVGHVIYADDITIWSTSGPLGSLEQNLQHALDTTQAFLQNTGLKLSTSKSELLLCKHGPRKGQLLSSLPVHLHTKDGGSIPICNTIKVLGMVVGAYSGDNAEALKRIEKSVFNFTRVLSRVNSRRAGLKEDNLMKAFHAFLISHVTYAAPFLNWKKTELNKIDTLIRTGLKRVLSLPRNTSTERLLQLGLHNTATELFEAQRHAQISRLSLSKAGNEILFEAGLQPFFMPPEKSQLCTQAMKAITVDPIPRNIHPTHNEGRRKARAKAILAKIMCNDTQVLFVDAAKYWNRGAYAVSVVDAHGSLVNAATVVTNFTHEAEEMAIALALRSCTEASVIYSDSRTAIRTFSAALVSSKAAAVVNRLFNHETKEENFRSTHIAWFPAHMGNISGFAGNPNERAHTLARELTFRVSGSPPRLNAACRNLDYKDPLVSYHELTSHHRLERRTFPPPHRDLNRAQAITYRQLQTRTYITPTTLSRINPDFSTACPHCGNEYNNFDHMLWLCPANVGTEFSDQSSWDSALRSTELIAQLKAVQRARAVAERLCLPVPTWVEPPD